MNLYKDVPKDKAGLVTNTADSKRVQSQDRFEQAKGVADTLVSAVSATAKAVGNYARQFTKPDAWTNEPPKVTEKDKYKVFSEVPKQDMLALEYPRFAKNINKLRAEGYTDEELAPELAALEMEHLATKGATAQSADKFCGRTEQSKRNFRFWSQMNETAGLAAVAGHLTAEQIERRQQIAKATGLSPSLLIFNDKLTEAIEKNANFKENEGWWQTISEAWKRSSLREERADLYIAQLNGETPKDKLSESYNAAQMKYFEENGMLKQPKDNLTRIKEIDKELAELAPSPFEGSFQRTVGQTVENMADWIDWQDIALMAASGGLGAISTVGSGLSKAQKAAKAWKYAKNAYKISMVERTFKREFAEKHEELTGYGIDRDRAVNVATMYAVLSTWAEYGQLETLGSLAKAGTQAGPVAKLFGLSKRDFSRLATESPVMQQALEKTTMDCAEAVAGRAAAQTGKKALNPTAEAMLKFTPKQVMAQGVRNVVSGLVEEDLEEVAQRFYSNLANEVAAYAQGNTKYQHMTAGEILLDSVNAGVEALPSLALMVGGGGAIGMARGSYAAHNFQKDNAAVIARLKYEEKAGGDSHLAPRTSHLANGEQRTTNNDQRTANYAYVDKAKMDAAIEQIAAVSPEAAENFANSLMLSPETTIEIPSADGASHLAPRTSHLANDEQRTANGEQRTTNYEYVIDKDVYDELLQTLPEEQARAVSDTLSMNIREGAMGVTGEEIAKFYEAKTHDPFENKEDTEAQEAISIRAQLINDLEAAGQSSETSQTVADIYSRYLYVASKQFGTTVDELHNLSVRSAGGYDASNPEEYLGKTRLNQGSKFEYERRLEDDTQAWEKEVDDFVANKGTGRKRTSNIPVMKTPLAMVLAGAEHLDIVTNADYLSKILYDPDHQLDSEKVKQLPSALADPVMVFQDPKRANVIISLLEFTATDPKTGEDGNVIVPVALEKGKDASEKPVHLLTSAFPKTEDIEGYYKDILSSTGTQGELKDITRDKNGKKVITQITSKLGVLYLNKQKSSNWLPQLAEPLRPDIEQLLNSLPDNIPNEQDLVNARAERNNKFYQDLLHASKADGIIRFDHGFMGTGEGQQIYGWGTYGAMAQAVVDWYLEQFRGYEPLRAKYNGTILFTPTLKKIEGLTHQEFKLLRELTYYVLADSDISSPADAYKSLIDWLQRTKQLQNERGENAQKVLDWLDGHKDQFTFTEGPTGTPHLYKFRVPDVIKGENYLDWDNAVPEGQLKRIYYGLKEQGLFDKLDIVSLPENELYFVNAEEKYNLVKDIQKDKGLQAALEYINSRIEETVAKIEFLENDNYDDSADAEIAYNQDIIYVWEQIKKLLSLNDPNNPTADDFVSLFAGSGEKVYRDLSAALGSDKAASQFLDSIGIVGNIYLDGISRKNGDGTYNFVIFNEDNAQIIEQLFQEVDGEKRGSVEINRTTGSKLVELFAAADSSTFVHEMGHVILEDLIRYGQLESATDTARANLKTVVDFLGISDMDVSDLDHLSAEDSARLRAAHEKWAEAFGKYIADGVAPSTGMRAVFKQVRRWLIDLFTEAERSGVELSPEVRGVFDSLLATPQEMDEFYEANTTLEELLKENSAIENRLTGSQARPWELWGVDDDSHLAPRTSHLANNEQQTTHLAPRTSHLANGEQQTTHLAPRTSHLANGEQQTTHLAPRTSHLANNEQRMANDERRTLTDQVNERIKRVNEINRKLDEVEDRISEAEEVKALLEEQENLPTSRKSLLAWLRDSGKKISLSQAQADFAEDAIALRDDIGGKYFSESGVGLDELAQDLQNAGVDISSADELLAALMAHDMQTPEQKKEAARTLKELKQQQKLLKGELAEEEKQIQGLTRKSGHKTATEALFERLYTNRVRVEDMAKVVREINKCVTDQEVIWSAQEEILQTILDASQVVFRKSRRKPFESVFGTKRLERAATLYEQIKAETGQTFAELAAQDPQSAGYVDFLMRLEEKGYDIDDLKLSQMKLAELTALAEKVTQIRARGKAEYKLWKAQRQLKVDNAWTALMVNLRNQGHQERKTVMRGKSDLGKDYSGVVGKLAHLKDWGYAATLGANRFFDWLGGGKGKYNTVFTRIFVDSVNDAKNEELRWTHARREAMIAKRKELGIKMEELGQSVIVGNEEYTVDELMSIYAGMKNDKSAAAIKFGNLAAMGQTADAHIAQCIAALEDKYKALADFVIEEYEQHFDRMNKRFIKSFNKGMQHEPNYTPMRRLEYSTSEGVIDAIDKAFMQQEQLGQYGASVSLEQNAGFMKSRLIPATELAAQYQTGIELGLMSVWNSQVAAQEHTAAFADVSPMLQRLVRKSEDTPAGVRITLKKLIADSFGKNAWRTLTDYVNLITLDDITVAGSCLNGFANFAGRNMAVTYLAANLGIMLKQFTSVPRFMLSASPARIICAMADATRNWKRFSQEIYEMDPQMRDRVPNAWLKLANDREAGGKIGKLNEGAKNAMEALMQHISFCDRFVACVGWRATYDACMARGLSREESAREAGRAVVLTQQTQQMKDAPRIWQQKGVLGLAMIFTSDCAQTLGLGVYDLVQSFRRGDVPAGCRVFAGLLVSACLYKAACDGLPDGDDDESWLAWLSEALAQQSIESMPLVGKDLYASVDRIYHKGWHPQSQSPFIAPFGKIIDGTAKMAADDSWREGKDGLSKFERGMFDVAEGCSLLGLPIPAVAGRRAYKAYNYIANDEYANALMTIAGMRVKR